MQLFYLPVLLYATSTPLLLYLEIWIQLTCKTPPSIPQPLKQGLEMQCEHFKTRKILWSIHWYVKKYTI